MEPTNKIDFVITWVNGNDPNWQREKSRYMKEAGQEDWAKWGTGELRYRDWDLLRYWFRSIEKNAPWVNKIYFVTWGHYPSWFNLDNSKLKIVRHDEYIPQKYLPTFNSHVIEWNLHRIEGLSEQFVYFNDDTFLIRPSKPQDFFRDGLPVDFAGLNIGYLDRDRTSYNPFDAMMINRHFKKNEVIKNNPIKWFYPFYGMKCLLRTYALLPFPQFAGFQVDHLPMNLLRSTLEEIWNLEEDELDKICKNRFRTFYSYSPWLMRDWQRVKGEFRPHRADFKSYFKGNFLNDRNNIKKLDRIISKRTRRMICINDECEKEEDFVYWRDSIKEVFLNNYSQISSFEKYE